MKFSAEFNENVVISKNSRKWPKKWLKLKQFEKTPK